MSLVLMSLLPKGNKYPRKDSIFGWCFETRAWNVLARCSTAIELHLCHLDLKEDVLSIIVNKHKGEARGEGISKEKHVYANPTFLVVLSVVGHWGMSRINTFLVVLSVTN